jgi:hypothetical protein
MSDSGAINALSFLFPSRPVLVMIGTTYRNPDGAFSDLTFYSRKRYDIIDSKSGGWYSVLKPEFDANLQITIAPDTATPS